MTQGVDSVRPSWKRNAVVALIAFVGTQVASISAWLAVSALTPSAAFLVSLIVIGICGWVTTRLGRLPLRLALGVAGLDQKEIKAQYHRVEKDSKNFGRVFVHFRWK
jgi:hypothetical protein